MNALKTLFSGSIFSYTEHDKEFKFIADYVISLKIIHEPQDVSQRSIYTYAHNMENLFPHTCDCHCNLCGLYIDEGQYCYINNMSIDLHYECVDIINNMINTRPAMSINLKIGDKIESLDIYGIVCDNIMVARSGPAITYWHLLIGWYPHNIYEYHLYKVPYFGNKQLCASCTENVGGSYYTGGKYHYCEPCGEAKKQFNYGLLYKWYILNWLLVRDLGNKIICIIVDIYTDAQKSIQ